MEIFFPQSLACPGKFKVVLETLIKECPCENEEKGVAIFISEEKKPPKLMHYCYLSFTIYYFPILNIK